MINPVQVACKFESDLSETLAALSPAYGSVYTCRVESRAHSIINLPSKF